METRRRTVGSVAIVLLVAALGLAQEKTSPPDVPLRMTVVFNEYDGSRKIASLPYEMPCKASTHRDTSQLRIGFRVPYKAGHDETQFQDVGTKVDCEAKPPEETGRFTVHLALGHLTVYAPSNASNRAVDWQPGQPLSDDPVFGDLQANLVDLLIRDGQTVEAMTATDPVSGHVWKVEVTLNVVK
jgi:hypothetical protein